MADAPLDLSRARILVSNDDGIHAPGLKVLERVARGLSKDVWVVAPESEQSGAGHSLTLRRPLQVARLSPRRFVVNGTPTDCVLLAVNHIVRGRRPDLVLSGVNRGLNLGEDVHYSGTIAVAKEATLLGVQAIAFSQARNGTQPVSWATAEAHAPGIIRQLMSVPWPTGVLMNVNFPNLAPEAVTGIRFVAAGRRAAAIDVVEMKDPVGRPYLWIGDYGSDLAVNQDTDLGAIHEGAIPVTPLHLDLTHGPTLRQLRKAFE